MQTFSKHTGMVLPFDRVNVDTDQMVPKQFLKLQTKDGYGKVLFYDWRYLAGRKAESRFHHELAALQGRFHSAGARGFRFRVQPRACAVGACRLWIPRADRAGLRGYFLQQLFQERDSARSSCRNRRSTNCSAARNRKEGYSLTVDLPAQTIAVTKAVCFINLKLPNSGNTSAGRARRYWTDAEARVGYFRRFEKSHHPRATMYSPVDSKYASAIIITILKYQWCGGTALPCP